MKIDIRPLILMNKQLSSTKQQPGSDFFSLLPFTGEGARRADEGSPLNTDSYLKSPFDEKGNYYWQHQSQLQQSALTFNSTINAAEAQQLSNNNIIKETPIPPLKIDDSSSITCLSIKIETNTASSTNLTPLNIDQFIAHIKTNTEQTVCMQNNILSKDVHNKTRLNAIPKQNASSVSAFKHYQLFTDDSQQVEITLNISQLSKQHLNQLKQFIQQYLTQKGYRLKQLMINGVKQ